jgi:glycine/D-amino acid oxidase-like deaminating enzyme
VSDCDVAVVSAGVVGGAIACDWPPAVPPSSCSIRGGEAGAAQASAGMLVPYIEGFGRPILPMAARSLAMYHEFIERVSRDSGIGVGYQRTVSLQVTPDVNRRKSSTPQPSLQKRPAFDVRCSTPTKRATWNDSSRRMYRQGC